MTLLCHGYRLFGLRSWRDSPQAITSSTYYLWLDASIIHLPNLVICAMHGSLIYNHLLQIFPWVGLLLLVVYFFYAVIGMQVSSVQCAVCSVQCA